MGAPKGGNSRTAELPPWIEARADGVVVALHVQPGARRTAIVGTHGERLKVAVSAPPTEGRANAALIDFLARRLALPKASLQVLSGATSRDKRIAVATVRAAAELAAALAADGQ